MQVHRVQQPQTQTVQVNAANTTTSSNTITLPIVQDTSQNDHNVDQSSGTQGNNLQSVGTVVVPIATNQDGTVVSLGNVPSSMMLPSSQSGQIPVMYSVYASPSSGLVTVSNLSDGGPDQTSGHTHTLSGEASDMAQQTLPGSLSLATVQVHQDINSGVHAYATQAVVTESSGTQTADDIHTIVSDHGSLTVGTESDTGIVKSDLSVSVN